jgi:hypothetical protein
MEFSLHLSYLFDVKKGLINPNVAKAGGLQSPGVKGEAVVGYPSNSPMKISKNYSGYYDIGNNYELLAIFCHVVYATKGSSCSSPIGSYFSLNKGYGSLNSAMIFFGQIHLNHLFIFI